MCSRPLSPSSLLHPSPTPLTHRSSRPLQFLSPGIPSLPPLCFTSPDPAPGPGPVSLSTPSLCSSQIPCDTRCPHGLLVGCRYEDLKQHADLYFLGSLGFVNFNNIKSVRPLTGMTSMVEGKVGADYSDYGLEVRRDQHVQCSEGF